MPYDRHKEPQGLDSPLNAALGSPVEDPKPTATPAIEGSMLARSVEIMETWSLLFGPATIECAYLVDGHMFVRLTNGHLLVDPEEGAGLVISNQNMLS